MSSIKKIDYNKIDFHRLSKKINDELEKRNWSYLQLAKISSSSRETIRGICVGENVNPKINTIEAIANALDIDIFDLLGSYEALSVIEEKNIPLYSFGNLSDLSDKSMATDRITCLVKGSDHCFAIKVEDSLEHILVASNSLMVDAGDVLIFDEKYDFNKIKNRSIVVYFSEKSPIIGEVMGIEDNGKVFISQRKDTLKHPKIDIKRNEDIIALLSSIQFA